ncbi:ABC transporter substrate-binding protein [Homoserinibacter sp. GY 40078]|uniref:ABC transporter substrate-binding protein n=1 Tax=Homoserinibacter sp. GY 40078 TaxID=2603275 RepID=UPI0011C94473|nr:ABC transporter substrate-binding protein [Homoserinibacter sp. GY 40078]TXK18484.1 carbohydrate ABC transporter substrate-binding protein [Homoserinibacter sp. GY 40078]
MNRTRTATTSIALAAASVLVLSACSTGDGSDGVVEITIAGPNQWNSETTTFGAGWDQLIADFEEANPDIRVKTNVLPGADWSQTLSTQLSAGTAPELIFNQAPHSPDQIVPLDEYLDEPNPYVDGVDRWIDTFNQDYFGESATRARNAAGNFEWIPFNLVIAGMYYNADAFEDAGVDPSFDSVGDLIEACGKLEAAGYDGIAADRGPLTSTWIFNAISSALMDKYKDELNQFDAEGNPGTAAEVTQKSLAKAYLTGELDPTTTPEFGESLRLMKEVYDACMTPNWSGINTGGAFHGAEDFLSGRAAIAWGSNFSAPALDEVDWEWGTFGFPNVSVEDSSYADGTPSRFGAAPGGTSYMIPSTTTGAKLEAAVRFMQFITSPNAQGWLDSSGGIPSTNDTVAAPGLEGLTSGDWAATPVVKDLGISSKAKGGLPDFSGYLLGTKRIDEELEELKADFILWAQELAADGGWTEGWASS